MPFESQSCNSPFRKPYLTHGMRQCNIHTRKSPSTECNNDFSTYITIPGKDFFLNNQKFENFLPTPEMS